METMAINSVSSLLIDMRDTAPGDEQVAHHIDHGNRATPWTSGNSKPECSKVINTGVAPGLCLERKYGSRGFQKKKLYQITNNPKEKGKRKDNQRSSVVS